MGIIDDVADYLEPRPSPTRTVLQALLNSLKLDAQPNNDRVQILKTIQAQVNIAGKTAIVFELTQRFGNDAGDQVGTQYDAMKAALVAAGDTLRADDYADWNDLPNDPAPPAEESA